MRLVRDVSSSRADAVGSLPELDANRVPLAGRSFRGTDSRGCTACSARRRWRRLRDPDRGLSRTISVRPPLSSVMSRSAATFTRSSPLEQIEPNWRRRRVQRKAARTPRRKRQRNRERHAGRRLRRRPPLGLLAVEADGVHQHLALADPLLDFADLRAARGVVAVGNHDERLLRVASPRGEGERLDDGVVHRRAAVRRSGVPARGRSAAGRSSTPARAPGSC